jgi:CHAD domain-containing protein
MAKFIKWMEASPDELLEDVAVRSLDSRLQPVMHFVPLAAKHPEQDVEYVHQMRVWARRASAAVSLYKTLLPKRRRKWISAQLKWIRRAANDARDSDVFALRLTADKQQPAAAHLLEQVRKHRRESQQPIIEVWKELFEHGRFPRRAAKLLCKVRLRDATAFASPVRFGPWAQSQIEPVLDQFFATAAGDMTQVEAMHQFRIAGKKLRYAIELLAPAFAEGLRTEAYSFIQDLQDKLGKINDLASAHARMKRWLELAGGAGETAYLQEMLDQEQRRLEERRGEFLAWWNGGRQADLHQLLITLVPARREAGGGSYQEASRPA